MEVWATYVAFREAHAIGESIRTIKAYVDGIVVVDAAFKTNDYPAPASDDGQREVVEAAADGLPVKYFAADKKMELADARTLKFRMVPPKCWALVIDGDETLLGHRTEVKALFDEIRTGGHVEAVGVGVYTAALVFHGHAPDISEEAYGRLPIIYTRGVQPRLVVAAGSEWRRVPNGRTYGLYRGKNLVKAAVDPRVTLVNHHTRQSYVEYQNDYVWETREGNNVPRHG